jgi:hypothetical protein
MGSGRSLRRLGQATGKILEETTMAESASIMELDAMLVDACKGYDEAIQAAARHSPARG